MKDLIKQRLRENLINELGTAMPVPYHMEDVYDEVEQGVLTLKEVFFFFKVGSELIKCYFKLVENPIVNGAHQCSYSFEFDSNSDKTLSNDIKTIFSKMMTIKEVIEYFIKNFKANYENKRNILYRIAVIGAAESGKGENQSTETQRTKLYDYFYKKFKHPDFKYIKNGNILVLQRNL